MRLPDDEIERLIDQIRSGAYNHDELEYLYLRHPEVEDRVTCIAENEYERAHTFQ